MLLISIVSILCLDMVSVISEVTNSMLLDIVFHMDNRQRANPRL